MLDIGFDDSLLQVRNLPGSCSGLRDDRLLHDRITRSRCICFTIPFQEKFALDTSSPTVKSVLPAAIILAVIGWGGLIAVVIFTLPTVGPRWLFFFLGVLALTGSTLPLVAFLNRRFPSTPPTTAGVILRQAMWVGIYGATLAWLQIGRVLTPAIALVFILGLVIIEWLMRLREKSQWKPVVEKESSEQK